MVSDKLGENLSVCQPNATTYRLDGLGFFISTLAAELDGIRARNWNSQRVVIL